MIINDTHQTIFIHIPKCAGTTVRRYLQPFDETGDAFTSRVDDHPELGCIDYVHIPLFILRKYFPTEYQKVRDYDAYTVIRDPRSRFPSSFSQHLRKYGQAPIENLKVETIRKELDDTIKILEHYSEESSYLPYQYIHFQRQIDFIDDQGERIVNHVNDISDISIMLANIGARLGDSMAIRQDVECPKANDTVIYRNDLIRLVVGTASGILKPLLSYGARKKLKHAVRDLLFIPRDKKLNDIFESHHVREFVNEYYKDDIKLYREIKNGATREGI